MHATAGDVSAAFRSAISSLEGEHNTFETVLHARGGNAARPYAHVTGSLSGGQRDAAILANGISICGALCPVRRRREARRERVADEKRRMAAKLSRDAEREARKPAWKPAFLDLFPRRGTTLDQHAQVAALPPHLRDKIDLYLDSLGDPAVASALKYVCQHSVKSLRVKELFETLETFKLIRQHIAILQTRPEKDRGDEHPIRIENIFDLACGHGLLGVLLAHTMPGVRVVCVDLVRRPAFSMYVDAFRACVGAECLANLHFIEGDLASVDIPPSSFVLCVHACNEANKRSMALATSARVGFAAMPCCIPNGMYEPVQSIRHIDDDTRYAIMVGVIAAGFRGHTICAIDRRITNRHLLVFGGEGCTASMMTDTPTQHLGPHEG